ncbi:MAG: hypothetical protein FJW37_11460 [Acidobacteria bacterium]|nr:hypothetical protein [Acidobacteriota bacterium]
MVSFRIYRLKEGLRDQFRWSPHLCGTAHVRPRDYEEAGQLTARNEYHAWALLRESGQPLEIGDLLQTEQGELRISKYVGFEAAVWIVPAAHAN